MAVVNVAVFRIRPAAMAVAAVVRAVKMRPRNITVMGVRNIGGVQRHHIGKAQQRLQRYQRCQQYRGRSL